MHSLVKVHDTIAPCWLSPPFTHAKGIAPSTFSQVYPPSNNLSLSLSLFAFHSEIPPIWLRKETTRFALFLPCAIPTCPLTTKRCSLLGLPEARGGPELGFKKNNKDTPSRPTNLRGCPEFVFQVLPYPSKLAWWNPVNVSG